MNEMAGIDFKSIFSAIPAAATAQAFKLALTPIAGSPPTVTNHGEYYSITFTPDQEALVAAWIVSQIKKEPGPVRIESGAIALRVLVRQYWPYALALIAIGAAGAYYMTKRKGKR
jgi:hypothetical protein